MPRLLAAILFALLAPGCMIVQVGVTNPIPGLSKVAVAPFFNLSSERAVDGRRFASAYASELQKVPGFQVLPLGVAETAIIENELRMDDPEDVLRLADILGVDAVVVGAVTDYTPYYPPRIGLHVSWFAPRPWAFYPGVQVDPDARRRLKKQQENYRDLVREQRKMEWEAARRARELQATGQPCDDCPPAAPPRPLEELQPELILPVVRGQSEGIRPVANGRFSNVDPAGLPHVDFPEYGPTGWPPTIRTTPALPPQLVRQIFAPNRPVHQTANSTAGQVVPFTTPIAAGTTTAPGIQVVSVPAAPNNPVLPGNPAEPNQVETTAKGLKIAPPVETPAPLPTPSTPPTPAAIPAPVPLLEPAVPVPLAPAELSPLPPLPPFDPYEPLMSYTRMFDAADADLTAALRDYVELSGDLRSGGWEAYLHRSDDFIKFTAHQMIVEMLTLHGGEGKRRVVFKLRKFR